LKLFRIKLKSLPTLRKPYMTIKIKQRDITDCGAACVVSIAAYYKLKLPIARVRQLASTGRKGTNIFGLLQALRILGFEAKGVRGEVSNLPDIPKPAIAHLQLANAVQHYVVIYRTNKSFIETMDPSDGKIHQHKIEDFIKVWTGVLVVLSPKDNFSKENSQKTNSIRLRNLVTPHKNEMIQSLVGALAYTIIGLTTSIYVQKIVDYVIVDGNHNLLSLLSIGMILLLLIQVFILSMKNIFMLGTGQAIDVKLILGYYKHILTLPQKFFDSMRVGEIISRVHDAVKIRTFINEVLTNLAVNIFILIFSFLLMFTYFWKLALVVVLIIPTYIFIYLLTNELNKKVERKVMENGAELESQLVESMNSIYTIKGLGLEEFFSRKTEFRFVNLLKTVYSSGLNSVFSNSSTDFISRLFTIILLWVGTGYVLENQITPGELLSFYALIAFFTGPLGSIVGSNKVIQNAAIAADRLFEIMDLEPENEENTITLTSDAIGDIQFKNLSFRYGSQATVFEDFNIVIPQNKITAIVGESGSGKSTIIAILQKLYPIESGQASIGEYDLKYISSESLRTLISIVPQKIDLFSGNVIENIAIGEFEPDIKKIIRICKELGILEFIEKLPSGFTTHLGENGATLSGGQKQRLAIARALYRDPEILILDEATASLDSAAEIYIQNMVAMLRQMNKTIIIISHRLSSVVRADKIAVLAQGKVVEEGTHRELLRNKANYYKLWRNQFPGENDE
jgi:ATP-binding cassette, subfamily C, bacteriocin exporter